MFISTWKSCRHCKLSMSKLNSSFPHKQASLLIFIFSVNERMSKRLSKPRTWYSLGCFSFHHPSIQGLMNVHKVFSPFLLPQPSYPSLLQYIHPPYHSYISYYIPFRRILLPSSFTRLGRLSMIWPLLYYPITMLYSPATLDFLWS